MYIYIPPTHAHTTHSRYLPRALRGVVESLVPVLASVGAPLDARLAPLDARLAPLDARLRPLAALPHPFSGDSEAGEKATRAHNDTGYAL